MIFEFFYNGSTTEQKIVKEHYGKNMEEIEQMSNNESSNAIPCDPPTFVIVESNNG